MTDSKDLLIIQIPLKEIKNLRKSEKFILLIRLARYINQLSFCLSAYPLGNANSPEVIRQQYNSFLFLCGVLYEGLKIVPILGKEFLTYDSYKSGFKNLSKDKDMNFLKNNVLNKMRNGIVFHVDTEPIRETLQTLNLPRLDFIRASDITIMGMHYALADDVALNYVIGDHHTSPEDELKFYGEIVTKTMNLAKTFIDYSDKLIAEYIERKQWEHFQESSKNKLHG